MNIDAVCINNFLAISDARVELSEQGLVLIQGENLDDTSADSNGTGKSSIVDALCWCLYGTTARGVSGDAVVNRIEKKNCSVVVYLSDGDTKYTIQRTRKHKTLKNQTIVKRRNADGGETDLSKGTEKETQKVVNQIMGCSLDVFQAAVYSGQENMIDLPSLTDKNLKLIVEEAAGVDRIEAAYELARREMADVQSGLAEAETKRELFFDAVRSDKEAMEKAKSDMESWNENQALVIKTLKEGLKAAESTLEARRSDLKAMDEESIMEQKKSLIDASKEVQRERVRMTNELASINNKLVRENSVLAEFKGLATQVGKKIKSYTENPESVKCPTCGSPLSGKMLADMKEADTVTLKGYLKIVKETSGKVDELEVRKNALEAKLSEDKGDVDPEALAELSGRLNALTVAKAEVSHAFGEVEVARHKLNHELEALNPYKNTYETEMERLKRDGMEWQSWLLKVKKAEEELKLKKATVEVFSPAGVRALILDTVTPFLNQRTADYLSILSDGNLSAVWTTLSKTAKGELREKFSIEVSNKTGGESFSALSGGEKKKVRVATCMALQDLVSSRATKPISLWIADEIDSALDVSGLERLMTILNQKAKERGTVLIISHTNLRDWCSNVLTVRKENGLSTIEVV